MFVIAVSWNSYLVIHNLSWIIHLEDKKRKLTKINGFHGVSPRFLAVLHSETVGSARIQQFCFQNQVKCPKTKYKPLRTLRQLADAPASHLERISVSLALS